MERLTAREIQIQYGTENSPTLSGLSLTLHTGELVGIVGPNGAGKSTLVRALARTLPPSAGAVSLAARDLYRDWSARDAAREIAVVPQDTAVAFDFSVREIVEMGRGPRLPRHPFAALGTADHAAVQAALESAGAAELAHRTVTTLSGGERQRVLLARALAQEGDVLLLDEPTAHLDLYHQAEILDLARDLAHTHGKAVLAVLHDLNLAAAYCDRLILLSTGEIVAEGTPAEVLTPQAIADVYGARVWVRRHPVTDRPYLLPLPSGGIPELSASRTQVLVLCGGGTGAEAMHALMQSGWAVTSGPLNVGDTDAEAAAALGVPFPQEASFSPLSARVLSKAEQMARASAAILVTPTPFGPANVAVLEVALTACRDGILVVLVDPPDLPIAERDFTGGKAAHLWHALREAGASACPTVEAAVTQLQGQIGRTAETTRPMPEMSSRTSTS